MICFVCTLDIDTLNVLSAEQCFVSCLARACVSGTKQRVPSIDGDRNFYFGEQKIGSLHSLLFCRDIIDIK